MRRNAVKEMLAATGMSYNDLATSLKVSRQTIHRWATTNSIPEKYISGLMACTEKIIYVSKTTEGEIKDIKVTDQISPTVFQESRNSQEDVSEFELAACSTEELVQELTVRGWKVSLTKANEET